MPASTVTTDWVNGDGSAKLVVKTAHMEARSLLPWWRTEVLQLDPGAHTHGWGGECPGSWASRTHWERIWSRVCESG